MNRRRGSRSEVIAAAAVVTVVVSVGCEDRPANARSGSAVPPPVVEPAPTPAPPTPLEVIRRSETLADAISVARPLMTDTHDEHSGGTLLLTAWAADHLRWADVAVGRDETSFALVKKDVDAARGKRMCVTGRIIQIAKQTLDAATFFDGLMFGARGDILSFFAVASTGELVEGSPARFCGVVTGKYDYSNSGGGTGHAVESVGMFDLRDNRAR